MGEKPCGKRIKAGYAPIIVFAFNRADKLERLFASLERNPGIEKMDLFIFVDVPGKRDKRRNRNIALNQEVICFVEQYSKECQKFRSITVEVAESHKGLAESVISGVSKIINIYGKTIVLEDDLEVSHDFLDYMQRGLDFYEKDKKVWSVTGYCPAAMRIPNTYKKHIFLVPRASSWGWGIWADRWNRIDWEAKSYEKFKKDIVGQFLFNMGGRDSCKMLENQMKDPAFDSWAVRWDYQRFRERKFSVYPTESRVIHCGSDSRSTHSRYHSPCELKERYDRCVFCELQPDFRMIWAFKKATESV